MILSQIAIEAAAKVAYEHEPIEKIDLTEIPWDDLSEGVRDRLKNKAEASLTAALTVDGLCLAQATELWPPFNVGDRVTHLSRQENGTVTAIEDGCVVVEFDRLAPKVQKSVGKYDAAWFRMYPRGLLAAANDGEERPSPPKGKI